VAAFLPLSPPAARPHDQAMFDAFCHRHGHRVLLGERRIISVRNDDTGIHVHFRCWCGEEGEVRTGRPRPRANLA
jgi:hypothetical protein